MDSHYDFERVASKICDFISLYKREIQEMPAILKNDTSNLNIFKEFDKNISDDGECFEKIWKDFKMKILPNIIPSNHPHNFSEFPSPNSFTTIIGETLTSAFGGLTFSWKTNPSLAELESLTLDWYARLLDLPSCFMFDKSQNIGGGCFHETNSDVLHNIILAARYQYIEYCKKLKNDKDIQYNWHDKIVIYASEDCCPLLKQWCYAEYITLHLIETNSDGIMTATALKNAINLNYDIGMKPILIVTTYGTLTKFAIDEFEKIGKLIKKFQPCWLHIDGIYGGNSLILQRYSGRQKNFDIADSIAISPNQWLHIGLDCVALWLKNIEKYQNCFKTDSYLYFDTNEHKNQKLDFKHYGLATIRRSKALNLWITLRLYGKRGLERRLRKAIELTNKFAELLQENNSIEILQKKFTFVNFVLKNKNDAENDKFLKRLIDTRKLILTPMKLNGRFTIRFSIIYEHEREMHIARAAEIIHSVAREFI